MSRFLLDWLGEVRGGLARQLGAALLVVWVLPLALLVDVLRHLLRVERERRVLARDVVRCPDGHVVELLGPWQCPSCSAVSVRHGFSACPFDGTRAAYIHCACGQSVANPIARLTGP